ncbi:MAG: hypothetical protein J6T08_08895 [Lentisphaeria bacterium]|nr:hypothetical protein [Lentisphaeria bacterium]
MAKSRTSGAGLVIAGNVHLQGVGSVPAIKAGQIRKGVTLAKNFGYTSKVLSVTQSKSGKSIEVTSQGYDSYGRKTGVSKKTYRVDRLVGVKQ